MFRVADIHTGEKKFTGRSKGKILDNKDPEKRGRVIVDHPLVGPTVWIDYLNAPGMFSVPDIDDVVYIECDCGYATHPIAWGNVTYGDTTLNIPEEFQRAIPTNRGFYTPGGHLVELDDGEEPSGLGQGIRITTSGGSVISILEDSTAEQGLITLETAGGLKATLDGTEDVCTITTSAGATAVINGTEGITLTDTEGGELNIAEGKVALGNQTAELLDLVGQILTKMTTMCTDLSTTTAAGFGAPISSVAAFATLATTDLPAIQLKLTAITGSL